MLIKIINSFKNSRFCFKIQCQFFRKYKVTCQSSSTDIQSYSRTIDCLITSKFFGGFAQALTSKIDQIHRFKSGEYGGHFEELCTNLESLLPCALELNLDEMPILLGRNVNEPIEGRQLRECNISKLLS